MMEQMEMTESLCNNELLMDYPELCSRPFDVARSGMVMADGGSAMILMSEQFWSENKESSNEDEVYCEIGGIK